jgi:hypothetical protein
MRNLHQEEVKSLGINLEIYPERYLNHTPSFKPILRRRYLDSVYNDRLLKERRHKC